MVIGTPCSRPSSVPFALALSAAFAVLSASSERSTTTALSFGLTARIRAMWASVTSTDEIAPARIAAAVSSAVHCQTGPLGTAGLRDAALLVRGEVFFADFFAGAFFAARFTVFLPVFLAKSVLLHLRGEGYGP